MNKIVAIAFILAATCSANAATTKPFPLANMPFTCSTDGDCEFKTRQFGCEPAGLYDDAGFICSDAKKFSRALKAWNRKHPHDNRD